MANDKTNAQTRTLYQKYQLDKSMVFASEKQGFMVITRHGIEKIERVENITLTFTCEAATKDYAAVKAIATKPDKDDNIVRVETFGSAAKGEFVMRTKHNKGKTKSWEAKVLEGGNTDSWYVLEMAEKRAKSRAVLQICGLYELGFFGEDENQDDFKPKTEKNQSKAEDVIGDILDGK